MAKESATRRSAARRGASGKKSASIWTPANIVTCVRIVLVPVWLIIAELVRNNNLLYGNHLGAWVSFVLYVFISLTDKLDGYLARSRGEITDFGKFLDPIADKLSVICAFMYLMELGLVPSWCVLIVLAREFLISGLRMLVASKGVVVAASDLGKWKTAVTMVSICALLLSVTVSAGWFVTFAHWVGMISLVAAIALTAWSGADYLIKCWPYVVEQ